MGPSLPDIQNDDGDQQELRERQPKWTSLCAPGAQGLKAETETPRQREREQERDSHKERVRETSCHVKAEPGFRREAPGSAQSH